jgi:NAD(P)-dependent dehydrogenase (short-subunit alcohol dehydrogenase family)
MVDAVSDEGEQRPRPERIIVVTGAGGGLGTACLATLAPAGHLLLVDVNEDSLTAARRAASALDASFTSLRCDVTSALDVARLADVVADAGSLRALVHTAGISPQMADGRRVLDVDLTGTARVLDALLPLVEAGTAGVCIGSIAGYTDLGLAIDALLDEPLAPRFLDDVEATLTTRLDGDTGYVLAKRGVMHLCERLAASWGERGGRLVSIAPGLIDTGMGRLELENQEMMRAMVDATPVKRPGASRLPGRAEDIAQLVAFLCSDAASFISGCDIRVDGGLVGATRHLGLFNG